MDLLKQRIKADGTVLPGNILKVDCFLNHQIDPMLMFEIGKEFARIFKDAKATKVLTIETSGIAPAIMTSLALDIPLLFAKKSISRTLQSDLISAKVTSYTKGVTYDVYISSKYLAPSDHVLIIDDFLAKGQAALGLSEIIELSGASLAGVGIVIEKSFQDGCQLIKEKGIRLESLAKISSLENGAIQFLD